MNRHKIINRGQLRGKPLLDFCNKAYRENALLPSGDVAIFCVGATDLQTDELCEECRECKAHISNIEEYLPYYNFGKEEKRDDKTR